MDFRIDIATDGSAAGQMTYEPSDNGNLMNNVWLSLSIIRGTWFFDRTFGLRQRGRMKNTGHNARRVEDDFKEALEWLLDIGKAKEITVTAIREPAEDPYRLKLLVEVTPVAGDKITFEKFVEVV